MPGVEQVQAEVNPLPNGSRQGSRQGSQASINGHNNGNSSLSDLGERVRIHLKFSSLVCF